MEIRQLLASLHGLVDSGTIIGIMGGITIDELELLALTESTLREQQPEPPQR